MARLHDMAFPTVAAVAAIAADSYVAQASALELFQIPDVPWSRDYNSVRFSGLKGMSQGKVRRAILHDCTTRFFSLLLPSLLSLLTLLPLDLVP